MLLSRKTLKLSDLENWKKICFREFEASITNKIRPFPCIFGVKGFIKDQLRYAFMEEINHQDLAILLKEYLRM